jgi:hypothetical protein
MGDDKREGEGGGVDFNKSKHYSPMDLNKSKLSPTLMGLNKSKFNYEMM